MTVRAVVWKIRYEVGTGGELLVNLLGRCEGGKRLDVMVKGCRPYFYVLRDEAHLLFGHEEEMEIVSVTDGPPNVYGRATSRVEVRYPFNVPKLRQTTGLSWHGEADIIFSNRVRADHGLNYVEVPEATGTIHISRVKSIGPVDVKPRTIYLDIETHDEGGHSPVQEAKQPICSVAVYDTYLDRYGLVYVGSPLVPDDVRARLDRYFANETPRPTMPTGEIRLFRATSEKELLGTLAALIRTIDPDIVTGYYSEGFDFPYLVKRCEGYQSKSPIKDLKFLMESLKQGDRRSWGRFAVADNLVAYKKHYVRQSAYKLESVAMEHLGFGKVKRLEGITATMRNDPALLLAYNLWDVHLLKLLEEKLGLIEWFADQAFIGAVEIEDVQYKSRLVDGCVLQTARDNGKARICVPSKDFAPVMSRRGVGGEVFPPVIGIHDGTFTLDLSTEYPMVMDELNISPETRISDESEVSGEMNVLPWGSRYLRSPPGLLPQALRRLQDLRKQYKREMVKYPVMTPEYDRWNHRQTSTKFLINSFAGVMSETHWRMNDVKMFEDVTRSARTHLEWNRRKLEDTEWVGSVLGPGYSCRVVMGDTDSTMAYIDLNGKRVAGVENVLPMAEKLRNALNGTYIDFARSLGGEGKGSFNVKLENIYSRLVLLPKKGGGGEGAKKRYYGLQDWTAEHGLVLERPYNQRVAFKGIESRRWNNAEITDEAQNSVMRMVLAGEDAGIIPYMDGLKDAVFAGRRDSDLLIPCKYSREPDAAPEEGGYKVKQEHVVAMEAASAILKLQIEREGEWKWAFVEAVKTPTGVEYPGFMAIPFEDSLQEWEGKGYTLRIDHQKQWRKTVHMPVHNIYPRLEEVQAQLSAFG